MKWKNIRANLCPKCSNKLTRTTTGYECTFVDPYYNAPCGFFITFAKRDVLLEKLKAAR